MGLLTDLVNSTDLNWEHKPEQPLPLQSELRLIRVGLVEAREACGGVSAKNCVLQ